MVDAYESHADMPQVAVVVLNWNAWGITKQSLESLNSLRYPRYEVILVDNGSTTQPEDLEKHFPNLVFVQTGANLGYTGGNNAGIRVALARNADFVLILNNDVLIEDPNLLMQLVRTCRETPTAGIVAPHVFQYTHDGVEIKGNYSGRVHEILSLLAAGPRYLNSGPGGVQATSGDTAFSSRLNQSQCSISEYASVTQVCGCAMLISRALFEQVGYFDERLFMYDDEYDLCLRGIDAGFHVLQVSSTSVSRFNVCSQADMPSYRTYLLGRNRFLLAKKRKRWIHSAVFICLHLLSSFKLAITLFRHRRWQELTSLFSGVRDGILCRWGATLQLRILLMR